MPIDSLLGVSKAKQTNLTQFNTYDTCLAFAASGFFNLATWRAPMALKFIRKEISLKRFGNIEKMGNSIFNTKQIGPKCVFLRRNRFKILVDKLTHQLIVKRMHS